MVTIQDRREIDRWLTAQGVSVELFHRSAPKAQWYRPDGTPLPNLLPADPYHIQIYRAKGWTLTPAGQKPSEPLPHRHSLGKREGARCRVPGCTYTRQREYRRLKKE